MTRGQDSLAIGLDIGTGPEKIGQAPTARPSMLKVIHADQSEIALHASLLLEINAACGGKAVWSEMAK